jgi:hypothetical protein
LGSLIEKRNKRVIIAIRARSLLCSQIEVEGRGIQFWPRRGSHAGKTAANVASRQDDATPSRDRIKL